MAVGDSGSWFVSGHADGMVRFWDTDRKRNAPTPRVVTQSKAHTTPEVWAVGDVFVVSSRGNVEAWVVENGQPRKLWNEVMPETVERVEITSQSIVWATTDRGDVHVWPKTLPDLTNEVRKLIGRTLTDEERRRWLLEDGGR